MVDAAGTILRHTAPPAKLLPRLLTGAEAADAHASACAGRCPAPAQHPDWVASWIDQSDADTFVAQLMKGDEAPVFSLPLEVISHGPVKTARWMSGSHANGNFPAVASDAPAIDAGAIRILIEHIASSRPDIDILLLERQAEAMNGAANPLLSLPCGESPNPALSVSLEGGFDAVLDRSSGKRKRKKHRSQNRKFEALGGWRRYRAETAEQVASLLDSFFEMKRQRFEKLGITNSFAEPGVQRFFSALFTNAVTRSETPFILHGLEVGGVLRAVTGSSLCSNRVVCEFSSFADDEVAHASPGDFLFFENIREACSDGREIYDFSVGDEAYKRLWCDRMDIQFDSRFALTAKGRMAALAHRAAADAKRIVKKNDRLWNTAKSIRRSMAGG